jgi:hypothetical protein
MISREVLNELGGVPIGTHPILVYDSDSQRTVGTPIGVIAEIRIYGV